MLHLGVKKGDRVMIYIPNCIQWIIGFLAIQKIGAVFVPISPIYTSFEIEYMIKDSGVETVLCQDTNFCYVKEVLLEYRSQTHHCDEPCGPSSSLEKIHGVFFSTRFLMERWNGTHRFMPSRTFSSILP